MVTNRLPYDTFGLPYDINMGDPRPQCSSNLLYFIIKSIRFAYNFTSLIIIVVLDCDVGIRGRGIFINHESIIYITIFCFVVSHAYFYRVILCVTNYSSLYFIIKSIRIAYNFTRLFYYCFPLL